MNNSPLTASLTIGLLAQPESALASTGVTVAGLLLALLAVGSLFWMAYAFIAPFWNAMLRIPRSASRLTLFWFAVVAFTCATVSVVLGKTTLGAGVVLQAIEPERFWLLVKFQFGAGCVLLLLALVSPARSR